jgi:YVTN family beta-propeller protein
MLNINYPCAYIVNGGSNNISVFKLSNNTISETISLNGASFPHHIYINPSKTKLAVAITSTDLSAGHSGAHAGIAGLKIQIIDAMTGMIDKEIPLNKMPHNAVYNKDGTELWLGQMDTVQSKVLVYKVADWSLLHTINVGKGLSEVTFSHDGTMAFAANTMDGTISMIDASSKMIHSTIPVGLDPIGAWPASNGHMYIDNEMSQTISEIAVSSASVVSTINLGFMPGYVAYNTPHNELWVSDATNGKVVYYKKVAGIWTMQGSITTGANAHAISFSADESIAFVTNQNAHNLSKIDVATHTVLHTVAVGTKPNGIAIKE